MADHRHFPEEILIEILTRLPVKSLVRFTAVSKSWFFFITRFSFASAHLRHSLEGNSANSVLLLRRFESKSKKEKYEILNSHSLSLTSSSELSSQVACRVGYSRVVGCYNGVVCLYDDLYSDSHAVTLWNPSIRKHLILPPPTIKQGRPLKSVLGFGVNPNCVYDLKVVRVAYERNGDYLDLCALPPEAEIYSLSTGEWRRISAAGVNFYMTDFIWSQTFVCGAIHWIGCKSLENERFQSSVAVFSMADELFGEIMLPDELTREPAANLYIMALDESISVVKYNREVHRNSCELWVMKEYGVVESWSRLHSIELVEGMERMVGFGKNGDIFFSTNKSELVSYCPNTQVVNKLGFFGTCRSLYVANYVETLLLLQDHSCIMEGLAKQIKSM
ncbi:unnamed protein product [Cuscuta europaea]|uniref:F-box domain-containing protein n=1 Tax=Cuscuta europaea TaxID=41803 RepID=A0A9P0ZZL7_CUSEU|nr:unnamed protein product [Cuscuta europaea]